MRRVLYFLAFALAGYVLLALVIWWRQDDFVFPGRGLGVRAVDVAGVVTGSLAGGDGATFRTVRAPARSPLAVVVFFVGNGEDLCSAARRAADLAEYGVTVWSCEYPGYGASTGAPGVASLFAAADALAARAGSEAAELGVPLVVAGASLGTFCAIHVAAAGHAARCLLFAPPTTMAAAAARAFWWLPVRLLLRHRFDNLAVAPAVRCPVLVVHGDADQVVPLALGQQLRAVLGGPAELLVVPGGGHNDVPLGPRGPVAGRVGPFLRGD